MGVSWIKTQVQAFDDILHATVVSVSVSGENVEVTQRFTYLGRVNLSSTSCELEPIDPWTTLERDEFAGRSFMALPILVQKDKGLSLAGLPGLAVFL